MPRSELFPLSQVAFVLREPVREIARTVEKQKVSCNWVRDGGRRVRAVDFNTLVFLDWEQGHRADVKPRLVQKFYADLQTHSRLPLHLSAGGITASFEEAAKRVHARVQKLRELEKEVERRDSGEVVLKGTNIEVHRIAALLDGGMTAEEVREDYPSLSVDQVTFAQAYSASHPKLGRPYPKLTAKAALRQVDFSSLNLDD